MPPVASPGLRLEAGSQSRLDEVLGGGAAQRSLATGAAFEQLFSGQLSGRQEGIAGSLVKNRLARGLRGAAAEDAATRLREQLSASNRVSAAEFLGQSLGRNILPQLGAGSVQDEGTRFGEGPSAAFIDLAGGVRAQDTAPFGAFSTELAGLRALGLSQGGAAVNRRVQGALAGAGGDRAAAFAQLFGTTSLETLQPFLDPQSAIQGQIGAVERSIREQIGVLSPEGGRLSPHPQLDIGLRAGQTTGLNLEINDQLLRRLGLRTFQEAGGFHNVLAGIDPRQLAQLAQERLGVSFGGAENVTAEIVSGTSSIGRGRAEGTAFLAFEGADLASQAELVLGLSSSGFARREVFESGVRENLQTLRELQQFQGQIGGSARDIDLLRRQQSELAGLPTTRTASRTVGSPLTGNRRTVQDRTGIPQAELDAQRQRLSSSIADIGRFRTDLFSPDVPFFT